MKPFQVCNNAGNEVKLRIDAAAADDHNAPSTQRPQRRTAGFSLIEVTFALGVAAICLIVLMGLLPVAVKTQQSSIQQTTANQIISQIYSFLRADVRLPPGQYKKACPDPPDPNVPCDWDNLHGHWAGVAQPDTMYFTKEANQTGSVTQPGNVPSDAVFRATITYIAPPVETTSLATIRVTWPAAVDPDVPGKVPAGSVKAQIAVNR